jgi:hypothetical protein
MEDRLRGDEEMEDPCAILKVVSTYGVYGNGTSPITHVIRSSHGQVVRAEEVSMVRKGRVA